MEMKMARGRFLEKTKPLTFMTQDREKKTRAERGGGGGGWVGSLE